MAIVGKTVTSPAFRRSRWLLTAVLGLYFIYTIVPIFYVIVASTKDNPQSSIESRYRLNRNLRYRESRRLWKSCNSAAYIIPCDIRRMELNITFTLILNCKAVNLNQLCHQLLFG